MNKWTRSRTLLLYTFGDFVRPGLITFTLQLWISNSYQHFFQLIYFQMIIQLPIVICPNTSPSRVSYTMSVCRYIHKLNMLQGSYLRISLENIAVIACEHEDCPTESLTTRNTTVNRSNYCRTLFYRARVGETVPGCFTLVRVEGDREVRLTRVGLSSCNLTSIISCFSIVYLCGRCIEIKWLNRSDATFNNFN